MLAKIGFPSFLLDETDIWINIEYLAKCTVNLIIQKPQAQLLSKHMSCSN